LREKKMKNQTLKLGIPNGSLVDPQRGGLKELLDKARIFSKNIGTNAPPEIINIPWLEAVVGRPQELPALAYQGYCDIFFCGDDWAREWWLRGYKCEKLIGLDIGKVDIVVASKKPIPKGVRGFLKVATEYPYLAKEFVKGRYPIDIVEIGDMFTARGGGAVILTSAGATEAKAYYGLADVIVEATQSGTSIANYGMKIREGIMTSECSLYIPSEEDDPWKMQKAERIKMMLSGVLQAKGKDLVVFNIMNTNLPRILDYIKSNQLYADEETLKQGPKTSEITLELSTTDRQKPLIDILGDLKDLGATAIEGVPLSYSVR
jgi:ATP phosphoribosyltransferase